jgi:Na+:H+ antiporter, NhaA family
MRQRRIDLFKNFFTSEKAGGFILIACTAISLTIANTGIGEAYINFWHTHLNLSFFNIDLDLSLEHWINDGLMAVFFLLVGLEIERELYVGELASFKRALLPIVAAIGGMAIPALIHYSFNAGTPTVAGFGIPMATDIAFSLGILSLLGNKVPVALKIFLTALAIIDDLGAITVIALFYTDNFSIVYLLSALGLFLIMFFAGRLTVHSLWFYIPSGIIMWYLMMKSGVHASIAGVLLAFAIPFHKEDAKNTSYHLQHSLHYPVAYAILPVFAFANTAIHLPNNMMTGLMSSNSLGILLGLVVGKFIGIFAVSYLAVKLKLASLSRGLHWKHIAGVALLGGIGFTMSIFITNLAYSDGETIINSKISIIVASLIASVAGYLLLKYFMSSAKRVAAKAENLSQN